MPAALTIGTASGNKDPKEITIGTTGGNKTVQEGWIGTASGNKQFFAFLTASIPTSADWQATEFFAFVVLACTPSGGVTPYTYAWTKSGNMNISGSSTSATVTLIRTGLGPWTAYCTVTDANGNVAVSNTCTITPDP